MPTERIYPVILAGGSGTRLWPMSRDGFPKQFLPLLDGRSPLQATVARLEGLEQSEPPVIVANQEHRFVVLHQLEAGRVAPRTLYLEPFGRSTAPAAGVVALDLLREDPEALMLVLPADHDIPDVDAFHRAVALGAAAAREGRLVVFGVEARWPEPGYGYVERAAPLPQVPGCYQVSRFVEKPELEIARRFLVSGRHYWNSGIFLFSAERFVAELRRWQPELEAACRDAAESVVEDRGCRRIGAAAFGRCRPVSIDYAVLEHTDAAAVVPAEFRWSDIGSWNALWDRAAKDAGANAVRGDVHLNEVRNSLVFADRRMVVAVGLENVVIIDTPDALLVADRGDSRRVRETVEQLRENGRPECRVHRVVHRPWGCYEDIDSGGRFRVKRITVNPGAKLSLQLHHHRAEHWVVVSGTARVVRGEEELLLTENQSTYIPVGVRHRLENPGKIPLQVIEVQSGAYLAEDDIVRIEDAYQRA